MSTEITLDCNIRQDASYLYLIYKVNNESTHDIVIYNRISTIEVDGTHRYSPNNVYVDLQDATLIVRLMILPLELPPNVRIENRPIPDVSLLKAGEALSAEIKLSIPAKVRNPLRLQGLVATMSYDQKNLNRHFAALEPKTATKLEFTVGFAIITPAVTLTQVSKAFPGIFLPPLTDGSQETLTKVFQLNPSVSVLDYALSE